MWCKIRKYAFSGVQNWLHVKNTFSIIIHESYSPGVTRNDTTFKCFTLHDNSVVNAFWLPWKQATLHGLYVPFVVLFFVITEAPFFVFCPRLKCFWQDVEWMVVLNHIFSVMDLVTEVFIIVSLFADLNKLVVVWRCSVCDNAKARSSNVSFSKKIKLFGIKFKAACNQYKKPVCQMYRLVNYNYTSWDC